MGNASSNNAHQDINFLASQLVSTSEVINERSSGRTRVRFARRGSVPNAAYQDMSISTTQPVSASEVANARSGTTTI